MRPEPQAVLPPGGSVLPPGRPVMPQVGLDTRVYALLGDPVAHSLSPRIHNAALHAAGLDAAYVALRCPADDLHAVMRELAFAGGGGNVTVPHKRHAAAAVRPAGSAAERTGACNTFWLEDGELVGDNTDVEGFARALRTFIGDLADADVLLVGAGGAAAAVLHALLEANVASVSVLNRTASRARELIERVAGGDRRAAAIAGPEQANRRAFDLAVNATSLGLHTGEALPLSVGGALSYAAAFDLVYSPEDTPWVRAAREAGLPATDGTEMLVQQAAAAFERWWQRPAPIDAMRAALIPARD